MIDPKVLSVLCDLGVHCETCRDREHGQTLRQQVSRETGWVEDFECPRGIAWGHKGRRTETRSAWPTWALAIKTLRKPEDRGVGDTLARVIGHFGGEAYKKWHLRVFGTPCGCEAKQAAFNAEFPY